MGRLAILVVSLVLLASPTPAAAWGHVGHKIVCDLAFRQLTPAGRSLLTAVLKLNDEAKIGVTFANGCVWADDARFDRFEGTYNYHFLNVPTDAIKFVFTRDCAARDCVTVAIQRFATIVAKVPRSTRDVENRAMALKFLSHFVADLHQPLHVSHEQDQGGNDIRVTWLNDPSGRNLHSIWDSAILKEAGYLNVPSARPLLDRINDMDVVHWQTFDLIGWTAESYQLAETVAYHGENGAMVTTGMHLDRSYFKRAKPIVETQIMKGSVRLAFLINQIAAGGLPRNMIDPSHSNF